ncbi:hypothetical protein [Micromonospora globbae]|uniref:hypothetical protein n=1 Tax=Micromonospora globbae TaxID=1894969 RepID=UPI0034296B1C|nr:hypothetical protein OH732_04775 [Micromonospora globbae]
MITIGIDPHKSSLTAVALDETGHLLATRQITVNAAAYKSLTDWVSAYGFGQSQVRQHAQATIDVDECLRVIDSEGIGRGMKLTSYAT